VNDERGWYVCGAVTHYFAAAFTRPMCGASVRRGKPFDIWMCGTPPRRQCTECERRHRLLWLSGGPKL
jgi:hypothetical protein